MTTISIIQEIIRKSVIPITFGVIFLVALLGDLSGSETAIPYLWLVIGFPFGFGKMRSWMILKGGDLGTSLAVFVLNIVLGAIIGSFVLLWRMAVGVCRLPVLIYRLIKFEDTTGINAE